VRVPAGSVVAVRVAGGDGEETLTWLKAGADQPVAVAPEAAAPQRQPRRDAGMAALQFSTPLGDNGLLSLSSGGRELRSWAFAVIPDTPPSIRFAHEPGSAVNGTLELSYAIEDDYGVTEAEARFALAEPAAPDARPLYDAPQMPLTLPRRN